MSITLTVNDASTVVKDQRAYIDGLQIHLSITPFILIYHYAKQGLNFFGVFPVGDVSGNTITIYQSGIQGTYTGGGNLNIHLMSRIDADSNRQGSLKWWSGRPFPTPTALQDPRRLALPASGTLTRFQGKSTCALNSSKAAQIGTLWSCPPPFFHRPLQLVCK